MVAGAKTLTSDVVNVSVWRGGEDGRFVLYAIPLRQYQTVLDAVTYIQRHLDPTLSYRFACRVGMCGSCSMMVNGIPRWTCRTHVHRVLRDNAIELAPLRNLPVIKDLAVDMTSFFEKWRQAKGYFQPQAHPPSEFRRVKPDSAQRRAVDKAIECINCGVCYAACDVVRWNRAYLGPAALNRAWALMNDVRDTAHAERLRATSGEAGCHACHTQQSCYEYCPKHLNPTESIAGLKRMSLWTALRGGL